MNKLRLFRTFFSISLMGLFFMPNPISAEVKKPTVIQNNDGTIFEKNLDGSKIVTTPDGTRIKVKSGTGEPPQSRENILQRKSDGSEVFTRPDGAEVKIRTDSHAIHNVNDAYYQDQVNRNRIVEKSDGTRVQVNTQHSR